jgi:hypothetical protein
MINNFCFKSIAMLFFQVLPAEITSGQDMSREKREAGTAGE